MHHRRRPAIIFRPAILAAVALTTSLWSQSVPAVTPEQLAKYDTNKNGVLDPSELEAMRQAESADSSGEVVSLSPFEVKADTKGYFQANTMSGTRLNSSIEDLGQSITVMTKDQMSDFAMLDINDVFDYMAGTEGTNTYSSLVVDRTGAVTDNIALDPNNANRVRGIGNANIAFNNIPTTGRVPVDPLWLDSIELSRGPNANIFGLGNSSGTVNQVPATANVTRDFTKVQLRADSYDGWRASLDANRVLLKDKLALRTSYAYQHTGFVRKPSGENARRLSVQLKIKPFKNTTVALSWYNYKNASVRPNFTTPRDNISSWLAAGKPSWDPVTRLITVNGATYGQGSGGTLAAGSTTPITTLPSYFVFSPSDGRSIFRIGTGGDTPYWTTPTVTSTTTPLTGVSNNIQFVASAPVNSYGTSQPLFASYAALSDKSIYDWEHINLMGNNKAWDNVNMYLAQVDQVFLNTPRHNLAGQLTFMREDAKRWEDQPFGPASVNGVVGEIYADPNTKNLDGTPNPYYGRPYLRSKEPYLRDRPMLWNTARAQLAYRLDLTRNSGWTKWLGTHQLLGYYEYKDQESRNYAWRHTSTSYATPYFQGEFAKNAPLANRTTSNNLYQAGNNVDRVYEFYYVGSTRGGGVEYSPSRFPEGATVPFVWGNTGSFHYDALPIGFTPAPDGSARGAAREIVIKTQGGVLQSSFLKNTLVTTFGLREDRVLDRNGDYAVLTPDLLRFDFRASDRRQDGATWRLAKGKTKTAQYVLRPFKEIGFLKEQASKGSGLGRFLAEALMGFSPFYNKSDNFIPQGPAYDLFLKRLPNQTGTSKDMGFWLTLFDRKLSLHYTHFRTDQINLRNGDISTIAQRVLRIDGLNANDRWNLLDRSTDWITQLNPSFTPAQIQAQVATTMGLAQAQIDGLQNAIATGTLAATQDAVSKGDELEVNFNPTRAWTVSASVTKTESINLNAGSTIEDWINLRMPVWTKVVDPRFNLPWWTLSGSAYTAYGYDSRNSAATNFVPFIQGPLAVYRQLEGRPLPQMAKYAAKFSTRYQLSGITENRILKNMNVGGALRWTDRKAIGFYGNATLPATITALDANRPIYTPSQTYVDLFVSYNTRLFKNRVRASFQLNVKNVGEKGGGLLPTQVFPDGTPLAYRIIDPRQFILSASFDL